MTTPADLDIPFEPDHFLAITVSRPASGVAVVLHVEGHLDHDTVPLLRQRVAPFLGHGLRAIVFDLAKLELMTSPGLGAFLNVRRTQETIGGQCLFVNVPGRIRRVLDVMDAVPAEAFANTREMDARRPAAGEIDKRGTTRAAGRPSGPRVGPGPR
jgi:anti-anti-sigma factor